MNSDEITRQPEGNPNAFWGEFDWNELNATEQRLWGVLGWNQANWEGENPAPASVSQSFSELTEDERKAAEQLGYTQNSWDAE